MLNEGLPILVSVHKIRPADEVEVAAHGILICEPVLPESIVSGPQRRYVDERIAEQEGLAETPAGSRAPVTPGDPLRTEPSTPVGPAASTPSFHTPPPHGLIAKMRQANPPDPNGHAHSLHVQVEDEELAGVFVGS